jgi:hypothetical protein
MDPYRSYKAGDQIPRDAATYSAFADGARLARDSGRSFSAETSEGFRQGAIIKIKNEAGADLTRGRVLGLGDPIFTPTDSEDAFLREVAFRGGVPSSSQGKFAILLAPIGDNAIGRAYIAGVCPARVSISDTGHGYADATATTDYLESGAAGSAQILWSEGGTGEQWAIIRFGIVCSSGGGGYG